MFFCLQVVFYKVMHTSCSLCTNSQLYIIIYTLAICNQYAIQKHPWCKKSEAKSEAPVTSIFCMRLKDVISGRGQGLLGFNHFVCAAIYNHVQANRNNAYRQTIETWTTKRTNCST